MTTEVSDVIVDVIVTAEVSDVIVDVIAEVSDTIPAKIFATVRRVDDQALKLVLHQGSIAVSDKTAI